MMKNNINLEIGERIRQVRTSLGLTREKLSEMLGISTLFLGSIECGQRGMSLSTLQNICLTLNVSADYILLGKNSSDDIYKQICSSIADIDEKYLPLALENINNFKKMIALLNEENKENSRQN